MIKIKIKKSSEKMIGGAGDFRPDSELDPELLDLAIDKEIGDHGLDSEQAKEVAKDEFILDDKNYSKEVKKKASRKLSEYWRSRAKRRAHNAGRSWVNKTDYNWALQEQAKSTFINDSVQRLFEKELQTNEEISGVIHDLLEKLKKNRQRKNKLNVKKFGPGTPNKANKSLSKPYPPHKKGETVGGYYRKAAKKLGGITAAPGEAIGPME